MTCKTKITVCIIGDYAPVDARSMATIIVNDEKICECYTNKNAELIGKALSQYFEKLESK